MAEHKVPQDVEADDKLIGPFSFRQFIYLMIAAAGGFVMFILGQIAVPLAFIPLPIAAFFLILALPLRKDQPMEVYLAALVKYYFKSRVRVWQADGEQPFVEISNPIVEDSPKTKNLEGEEVSRRLSFLATLSDTQGWSTRGLTAPINNTNLNDEFASDAVNADDIMEDNALSSSIDNMLSASEQRVRQNAINKMNQAARQVARPATIQPTTIQPTTIQPTTLPPVAPLTNNSTDTSPRPVNLQMSTPQPKHNQQLQTSMPTGQPSVQSNVQTNAQSDTKIPADKKLTEPAIINSDKPQPHTVEQPAVKQSADVDKVASNQQKQQSTSEAVIDIKLH